MLMNVMDLFLDFSMVYVFLKVISTIIDIRIFIEIESKKEKPIQLKLYEPYLVEDHD